MGRRGCAQRLRRGLLLFALVAASSMGHAACAAGAPAPLDDGGASVDPEPDGGRVVDEGDSGVPPPSDAGALDAGPQGSLDAGAVDAGAVDAGDLDAGPTGSGAFAPGPHAVTRVEVTVGDDGAPTSMLFFVPSGAGPFPVLDFQHGFLLAGAYYGELLEHVASHGVVVVAPQMYPADGNPLGKPSTSEEAALLKDVLAWLDDHLASAAGVPVTLPPLLAGHSRGAKVLWRVAGAEPAVAAAVAGIDPVDGTGGPLGGDTRVVDGAFALPYPTFVLGTGLGPEAAGFLQPACAPEDDNHEVFYEASAAPAWHWVATAHGHLDMLDDEPDCGFVCSACPEGPDRASMRALTAGALVLFVRAALLDDDDAAASLLAPAAAPAPLTVEHKP